MRPDRKPRGYVLTALEKEEKWEKGGNEVAQGRRRVKTSSHYSIPVRCGKRVGGEKTAWMKAGREIKKQQTEDRCGEGGDKKRVRGGKANLGGKKNLP